VYFDVITEVEANLDDIFSSRNTARPRATAAIRGRRRAPGASQVTVPAHPLPSFGCFTAPSSSGLGHHPLKVEARVRIPLGLPGKGAGQGRFTGLVLTIQKDPCPIVPDPLSHPEG
jgi:hypothetical protein